MSTPPINESAELPLVKTLRWGADPSVPYWSNKNAEAFGQSCRWSPDHAELISPSFSLKTWSQVHTQWFHPQWFRPMVLPSGLVSPPSPRYLIPDDGQEWVRSWPSPSGFTQSNPGILYLVMVGNRWEAGLHVHGECLLAAVAGEPLHLRRERDDLLFVVELLGSGALHLHHLHPTLGGGQRVQMWGLCFPRGRRRVVCILLKYLRRENCWSTSLLFPIRSLFTLPPRLPGRFLWHLHLCFKSLVLSSATLRFRAASGDFCTLMYT